MLELDDRSHCIAAHVFDCVLIAEPVGALDRVVHVPTPVVLAHIAERGADAALRRNRVAAGRENLGETGRAEAHDGHAEGRPQTRAASADDDHIVGMMLDWIGGAHRSSPSYSPKSGGARRLTQ